MKKIIFPFIAIALILGFASCGSEEEKKDQKIAFMDSAMVFESFQMKKDYDTKIETDIKKEADLVDALANQINEETKNGESEKRKNLQLQYYAAQNQFKAKFEELSSKYTKEVNERLNSYLKEFGKEKGYSIILGGGQGNVMYVDDTDNVTKPIIEYINKKYTK